MGRLIKALRGGHSSMLDFKGKETRQWRWKGEGELSSKADWYLDLVNNSRTGPETRKGGTTGFLTAVINKAPVISHRWEATARRH